LVFETLVCLRDLETLVRRPTSLISHTRFSKTEHVEVLGRRLTLQYIQPLIFARATLNCSVRQGGGVYMRPIEPSQQEIFLFLKK